MVRLLIAKRADKSIDFFLYTFPIGFCPRDFKRGQAERVWAGQALKSALSHVVSLIDLCLSREGERQAICCRKEEERESKGKMPVYKGKRKKNRSE